MKTQAIHTNEMTLRPFFGRLANQTTYNLTSAASTSTDATTHDHKEVAMKTKHMILAVVVAALFSVLPHASAQRNDYTGIPTNLPGVTTAPAPPSGFNPLTASDSELAAYGFPPRPDRNVSAGAYAAWEKTMKAAKERVFPVLELTNHFNGPHVGVGKVQNGSGNSYNWNAMVDTTSAKSYGSNSFTYIGAVWVVPIAQQAFGACTGGWDYESSWVGIDGYNSSDVFQAGTESDAYCNFSYETTYYSAWYEWYPLGEVRITSLPVYPGDTVGISVSSNSSTSGSAFVVNYNTNQYVQINFSAPAGTQLVGNSAEWVVERPTICNPGCNFATLTNYISDMFADGYAWTVAGTIYGPGSAGATTLTMVDNSGNPISVVESLLGSYGVWFADEGSAW